MDGSGRDLRDGAGRCGLFRTGADTSSGAAGSGWRRSDGKAAQGKVDHGGSLGGDQGDPTSQAVI